jgi:NitT/TauT family transport system permease protein
MHRNVWWRIWLPAVLVLSWEFGARAGWIDPLFFPRPSFLVARLLEMLGTGELVVDLRHTLLRTLVGSAIGVFVGTVCGLLMGMSLRVRQSTESLIAALISTPKISLLPLIMLLLGIGEAPRLTLIAATAFVVVALQMLDAVKAIDSGHIEIARNYGARNPQLIRWVYLPAAMPHLFTGIRQALGRALGMCITVEIVGAREGIGKMIWAGWESFQPDRIYIGIFAAGLIGIALHGLAQLLEKRLVPWKA